MVHLPCDSDWKADVILTVVLFVNDVVNSQVQWRAGCYSQDLDDRRGQGIVQRKRPQDNMVHPCLSSYLHGCGIPQGPIQWKTGRWKYARSCKHVIKRNCLSERYLRTKLNFFSHLFFFPAKRARPDLKLTDSAGTEFRSIMKLVAVKETKFWKAFRLREFIDWKGRETTLFEGFTLLTCSIGWTSKMWCFMDETHAYDFMLTHYTKELCIMLSMR